MTNLPISSLFMLTTDGVGGLNWYSALNYISASLLIPNLPSSINLFSSGLSTLTSLFSSSLVSFTTKGLSSITVSTQSVSASTMTFMDTANNTQNIVQVSSGLFLLNGSPIVPGTGINSNTLISTVEGLGTAGYVSTSGLTSTIAGLGTAGYVSTSGLTSTVDGLGTAGYVSTSDLTSTVAFLYNDQTYISSGNLISTAASLLSYAENFNPGDGISSFLVYGTANFFSTVSIGVFNVFIQDVSTLSTAVGIEIENLSSLTNNSSNFYSSFLYDNYAGWVTSSQLVSTVEGLGEAGYLSSPSLLSTVEHLGTAGYLSTASLFSTVEGLAEAGYLSSPSLISTVEHLGTAGYISSSQLQSTVVGLGGTGLITTDQLVSTTEGLGTIGYISSSQLQSTVIGLGGTGLISTGQLTSTIEGLGLAGYISTSQLQSTVVGLGGTGLISTGQLTSTVRGLGTAGYISSLQLLSVSQFLYSTNTYISSGNLISTTSGLLGSFTVVNSGNIFVNGGTLNVTNANDITVLSSFLNSTITYSGNNGQLTSLQNGASLYFSSANLRLDSFSSFIINKSLVSIDIYPTFVFDKLAYTLADWNANALKVPQQIFMSSFVQFGITGNYFSSQMSQTMFFPTNYDANTSNQFTQPMRIQLTGSQIIDSYSQVPYRLAHYLPNGYSIGNTNGFSNSNVTVFIGSTNSIFYSVQNLP